ncbi:MAG: Pyruvate:ferredoxin oxidoreductase, beta subunit [Nitrospira sp.]|jgi:pyruvate ferredoxin oxidoreductase beta subunit|nr:MAG: Pyruvate:ferredoxin oxidoreductase, beta subunit [Nitrospira sp.]
MSLDYVKFSNGFEKFMPKEYRDMVEHGPFGKKVSVSQMGSFKEVLEEHPMCAGCAMTLFIRLAMIAFPNPEDTITVGTAGCGRLAISQAAIPFVYGNYGDQNGVASGLSRGLRLRFGDKPKDVVVMAGDGGTADIGFQQVLHSWFRKERFTTIMLDNEVYGNTGGQESGMTNRGAVLKMAPLGKKFEKMDMLQMAKVAGCAYVATVVPNNPRRVESVIKKAVLIAREVGSTYIQAYTSCNIEYAIPTDKVMEDAKNVENDRYQFSEYISDEAKQFLTERYGYKEFLSKPAAPAPGLPKA